MNEGFLRRNGGLAVSWPLHVFVRAELQSSSEVQNNSNHLQKYSTFSTPSAGKGGFDFLRLHPLKSFVDMALPSVRRRRLHFTLFDNEMRSITDLRL
jgi:hypothetical protein